jgi:hypothetical protein
MRALAPTVVVLVFCTGCMMRVGSVNQSQFFAAHNAQTHLEAAAKALGCQAGSGSNGQSFGASAVEKNYGVSIKGDAATRDTLMREYKSYVEDELQKSGAAIQSRGVSGDVSAFNFGYVQGRLTGIFRVNTVIDADGYIQIDVFMYEHE